MTLQSYRKRQWRRIWVKTSSIMIECYAVSFTGLCSLIGSLEREEDDDEISSNLIVRIENGQMMEGIMIFYTS